MLERRQRIHTDRDHRSVKQGGRVVRSRTVVLRYLPSTTPTSRFGFVVSTAVAKKATARNRIKRSLRVIAHQMTTPSPIDVVAYTTKAAAHVSTKELQQDFIAALNQVVYAKNPRRHP